MGFTWTVPAKVLRIVDGDTIRLDLDLGWDIRLTRNARIIGVNSPEMNTPEGVAAKAFASTLLPVGALVTFLSRQLDKYGRPLGEIEYDGKNFAAEMINAGHAVTLTY